MITYICYHYIQSLSEDRHALRGFGHALVNLIHEAGHWDSIVCKIKVIKFLNSCQDLRARFWEVPPALEHYSLPPAWGLEADGVTISTGASLLPVFVHWTDLQGDLQFLG